MQHPEKEYKIIGCKLFRSAARVLGSEIMSEFGVSELLLLSKDPLCQVRKHAILAFGAVLVTDREDTPLLTELGSRLSASRSLEEDIFNALLLNARVPPASLLVRRARRGW